MLDMEKENMYLIKEFEKELINLINKYSLENGSDTPDFILARYLCMCLENFDSVTNKRNEWYKYDETKNS
jgi:hypothetical protein